MDKGMRIKELAELLGVTPDTVISWKQKQGQTLFIKKGH